MSCRGPCTPPEIERAHDRMNESVTSDERYLNPRPKAQDDSEPHNTELSL